MTDAVFVLDDFRLMPQLDPTAQSVKFVGNRVKYLTEQITHRTEILD